MKEKVCKDCPSIEMKDKMDQVKETIDDFLKNPDPAEAYELLLKVREILG